MKTIDDLIKWYQEECMDGDMPPKEVLYKMFLVKSEMHKFCMPEGINSKEEHDEYLKTIGIKTRI